MIKYSLRVLEYYRLLTIVSQYAASPLGRSNCLSLMPLQDLESINAEHRLVSEMKQLLLVKGFVPLSSLFDIRPVLRKTAHKGSFLEANELLSIRNLIRTAHQVKQWIAEAEELCTSIREIVQDIPSCDILVKEIDKAITKEGGIYDRASKTLSTIRSQRVIQRRILEKKLYDMVSTMQSHDDNLISIRDGRYVISLRTNKKGLLKGIVHGYSSTRSTSFIEPLPVVEDNNYLAELAEREKEEEKKVLQRLTRLVSECLSELLHCVKIMGRIDGLFARAEFSKAIHGVSPILSKKKTIHFVDALNPILLSIWLESIGENQVKQAGPVVPINVRMDSQKNILIISGPNRGGKTVALKTIGLLILMSQTGLHIPVKEGSTVSIFDTILAEIGDDQDIAAGLSTFSARMEHLKKIIDQVHENSLVILDELGTGTDPEEGTSLAMAILDYFSQKGSLCAISTHYQRLKNYGLIHPNTQNASVEFDYQKKQPTFRLRSGMPGVSHAIEIARDLGVKDEIIDKAAGYLSKKKTRPDSVMEDLVKMMEEARSEKKRFALARKEYELSKRRLNEEREALMVQLREMLAEKEHKAENILAEAKREFGEAIGCLKKKGKDGQAEATQRYTLAKHDVIDAVSGLINQDKSINPASVRIGQRVFHKNSDKKGWVVGIDENSSRSRIMIDNVKLTVDSSELIPESDVPAQKERRTIDEKQWSVSSSTIAKTELNLIGYTTAKALPLVDRMIDQALVHGYTKIKIIHGMGTGTLRRAIREHLKRNYYVKDFTSGAGEGENDGITVVEL